MPVLEKLKEEICTEDSSPYITETIIGKKEQNGSVIVDYDTQNNINQQNSDVLSKLSKSNSSSAHKLGFKKKASNTNLKHKSDDPFRFAGDGIDFKAKLIGFQDVDEPRGDQMCQDAIQACKAIVKRKGEHKQRILFNISLEGLKIKDQSGTKVLYTFPVAKVSFIAKDVADNRAFGFVYGTSEGRHKFYGIKTEKTADHVVFSIRDMFQIVYEMKKKQIEQAKQQQMQKPQQDVDGNVLNGGDHDETLAHNGSSQDVPVADLLDLETELENLEQGMQNMEKWTSVVEDSTESHSPSSPPSGLTSDSSGWATNSLSSSAALNESNDPFADHIFTSSTNSFGSMSGGYSKEAFVPPPPISSNSRRALHSSNGHSTLFGGDPFMSSPGDLFENGPPPLTTTNPNIFIQSTSSATDPFDTSHVMKTVIRNGDTTNGGPVPIVVSTPLQPKSSNGLWMTNGSGNNMQSASSFISDTSQLPSAIPQLSSNGGSGSHFDDFSANGTSVFLDNSTGSKLDTPSIFNNAASDSSFFKTSSSFNGVGNTSNGSSVDSSKGQVSSKMGVISDVNGVNGGINWGVKTSSTSSPLSIGSSNSSGSHSPQSPCNSKPNSFSRSLITSNDANNNNNGNSPATGGDLFFRNTSGHINVSNFQSSSPSIDDAFAKLCNLDTLVITPSRSSPLQTMSVANGNAGFTSLHEHPRSTPPKREDPFAFMKIKPKKSINQLREAAAGPALEGFEQLTAEKSSPQGTPPEQPGAATTRPPAIPPRSGQNFPAIPRPDSGHLHTTAGLLPPPHFGGKNVNTTTTAVEIKRQNAADPFADEFFS